MQANTEFEEGEAFFCYKDDDDDNIDLDSLSYIDERIQHALGHFRKEFEGGISADRLGAKFGDYGSFLPTCERSPPLLSCPKTPQKHSSSPKSPSNLRMVAALQNSKAPPNIPPSMRLGTASYKAPPFRNIRVPSADDSIKNTDISSNEVIEKFTLKDCANKSENLTDQRTLKLRIKVKSDILAKKNAVIYSGLGLDDSPSSSMENSHEESEDMPHVSQETPEESPTSIVQVNNLTKHLLNKFYGSKLRFRCDPGHCEKLWENAADAAGRNCGCYALVVMTSFTIPGGVLISPLHDSLLYLIRKEKALGNIKPMYSLNGHQEHYSMSTDESDSFVGDGHLLKKRKVTVVDQSDKQHMNGNFSENYMTLHTKKKLGNRTLNRKYFLSNDLRCTPLSSSICDAGETAEVTVKAFEVSKEIDKDGVKCRMVSTKAVKEDTLESISGQDFDKIEKQNTGSSFMQKMEISQNNNSTDPKINSKCNAISKRIKCDAMKCKVDQDIQKCETNQEGKVKSESKNGSKGERSPGKVMTDAEKDSIGTSNNAMVNDRKSTGIGITSSKSKMHKIKSMKDNKVTDCDRDSSKGKKSQHKVDRINPTDRPTLNKATVNSILDHVDKSAYRVNVKERPNGNKVVNQLSAGPCVKDAPGAFPIAENKPTSEMVPSSSAATPQVIEEDWVCCDSCQKWRLLPMGLKPEQLPEKWLCSMLYWLPGMNRCNISEEETTKTLYASYQMPIFEGQSNMQNCATGPETGVRSVDALQLGLNRKKSSSDVMLDRGKKKHGINEKAWSGINNDMHQLSNAEKNIAQESVKNRSLNDMNKRPADSNRMKKSISKHSSRLNNLIEEKNTPKVNEKQMNGGDRNHVRLKRKMEDNQHGSGTAKKSKTEDVHCADKQLNPSMEFKKVGLNSRNGLPTKASGKNMRKYDDYCWSDDLEDKLVVPVKKGDRAQFSSDDGSLDATNSSKTGSIKKRKMTDWLDTEKHNKSLSLEGDMQCGKEGNVNRREKKYIVLNMDAKSETERDDKLVRESGVKRVFSSDSRDEMAIGTEVKSVNKVQQPRKHKKNVASYQALDCFDPLGKDLGSGELSLAATSSSSKVSVSHKARTNLEDVRGSPLESVTSSPLWTSNMDKRILAAGDTSEKDDARKRGLSKSLDNREGKLSVKMKERISYDIHPAHGNCGSGSLHEEKMNKSNKENALSWQKSGKVTSLRVKEKDRISGSEVIRDKMKVSASDDDFYKNGVSYELTVDRNHHASGTETRNDVKNSSLKSNHKIANPSKKNSSRHWSNEAGKQTAQKQNEIGIPVLKVDATRSTNRKIISQQNLIQNFEEENKANQVCAGSRDGKAKVIASSEDKVKRETLYVGSRTAPESQKGDMSNGHPVHASGNDVPKFVRNPIDVSCKVGVNCSSESFIPDVQLSESGPVSTNSSQTASSILEEATKLKGSADHYKNSGFEFESNETYFKAALKFLHGASLLESSHSESSKHGETSQMQIYATTAKLFESCAHKYEKCQEMAAAALAYKCMEVVYMRLVYCKHSSINRDWHALQSTLQMVSQGESPSSSASDIDNLNNLAVVDKVTMTRGSNTHVANNQVISARNRPNIVRLLDFTQDINLAMEASRRCKSTYRAANLNMEEARNRDDCITSIRKVVDFSFQDVDELVHLVLTAMKAITCAGLGGVRD